MKLVIVESPAKCKKIESYLGTGYKCIASYGHIREFLNGLKSIDIEGSTFVPKYKLMISKKKYINQLRTSIKKASEVILATDDDREGEAIAWHICIAFQLPIQFTKRIIFHEITKPAIKKAIMNPTTIDLNKVYSQQSRQILDLLVGFKVSPVLWNNISSKRALSAGRCQSSALRLVYDNYKDIRTHPGQQVYRTYGDFQIKTKQLSTPSSIVFELNDVFKDSSRVESFLEESVFHEHTILKNTIKKGEKQPPLPFTTSRMQQKASNELGYSPKQTMMYAQRLYENGFITYMRTDSITYSAEYIKKSKEYIHETYGERYISPTIYRLMTKSSNTNAKTNAKTNANAKTSTKSKSLAQEAHEAIRPTNITRTSLQLNSKITNKELRLYILIYKNALASCMSVALYDKLILTLSAPLNYTYKTSVEKITFDGWKKVYNVEHANTDTSYLFNCLNTIPSGIVLTYNKINSNMTVVDLKQHFTESKLIQMLESKGIGRPSTYSSIISKIQEKGYVTKKNVPGKMLPCENYELVKDEIETITETKEFGQEKNKLVLESTGLLVVEFLIKHFGDLFEYDYTKNMENMLDKIASGKKEWSELCRDCNATIDQFVKQIKKTDKQVIKLDKHHTYTIGKYGPVIKYKDEKGKVSFKSINKNIQIDLEKLKRGEYTVNELVDMNTTSENSNQSNNRVLGVHDDDEVVLKNGKYGIYVTIGNKNVSLKFIDKPMDEITLEDAIQYIQKKKTPFNSNIVKQLSNEVSIRKGKYGPYVFYKTSTMTRPKFISMKGITPEEVTLAWVEAKLNNQ